jgi:hypothetical protein
MKDAQEDEHGGRRSWRRQMKMSPFMVPTNEDMPTTTVMHCLTIAAVKKIQQYDIINRHGKTKMAADHTSPKNERPD